MADIANIKLPNGTTYTLKDASAVASVTYSGHTVTVTKRDGTTSTFDTADNNTTYSSLKNPNALTVKYGGTTSYSYDGSAAKTLNIKAGSNVTVNGDTSGNITIAATNTTYSAITTTWIDSNIS